MHDRSPPPCSSHASGTPRWAHCLLAVCLATLALGCDRDAEKNASATKARTAANAEAAANDNAAARDKAAADKDDAPSARRHTLTDELAARAAASKSRTPQLFSDLTAALFARLRAEKVTERALQMGARAPDFVLKNAVGEDVALKDLLARGPVVLTWYRGGWCPYCNIQLRYYSRMIPELDKLGATLVAINPETPDESLTVKQRHHLPFEVLSDAGQTVARAYGIVFELTPGLSRVYEARFKMSERQGKTAKEGETLKSELPLAATYVVGQDGVIRWAFLDVDYKLRAAPEDILAAVKKVAADGGSADNAAGGTP